MLIGSVDGELIVGLIATGEALVDFYLDGDEIFLDDDVPKK